VSPIEGIPGFLGGVEQTVEGLAWMAGIGVTHVSLILGFDWESVGATGDWFAKDVIPELQARGLR
jgi:hypothetical protein